MDPRGETAGTPVEDVPRWRRTLYQWGRVGVWFVPVLGALGVLGVMGTAAFTEDAQRYAAFVANRWTSPMSVALTTATVVVACLGALGLGALLVPVRGRWFAIPGALLVLAGAIMMGVSAGSVILRVPGAAHGALQGRLHDFSLNPDVHGTAAGVLTLGGAALLTLGWIVLGVAVIRAPGLSTGDGAALIIAAPVVFLGGFSLHTLPTIGAFLFAGAGLGIASTAGRLSPERVAAVMPPRVPRSDLDLSTLFAGFGEPAEAAEALAVGPDREDGVPDVDDAQPQDVAPERVLVPVATIAHDRDRGSRFSRGMASAWQVNRRYNSAMSRGRKARNAKPGRPGPSPKPPRTDGSGT